MSTAAWTIDERHSGVLFSAKHLMVGRVHGQFKRFTAELKLDEGDLTRSSVSVDIDVASIDTGNPMRDTELRSEKFFVAEQFPSMTFKSRRVEQTGGEMCRIVGDLTIRGVSREVVLETELGGFVIDPWGNRRAGFTARASILRSQFGMEWNQLLEAGGVVVSDKISIEIEIEATTAGAQRKAVA
jgi:polyisoprenoid-binding protein YceI